MNIKTVSIFLLSLLMVACQSEGGNQKTTNGKSSSELRPAAGGKYYGGVFKTNGVEYFRSLYPLNITEVGGHRVTNQLYEGLVGFDQADLSIKPVLAESWTVSEDVKTYTFQIRKGVKFHDDACFPDGKGRELTVEDIKWCLDRMVAFDVNNKGYDFYKDRILGAEAYYTATKEGKMPEGGCEGIKITEDGKLQVILTKPIAGFLNLLALPFSEIYPREAWEKYKEEMRIKAVGTGPFFIKAIRENDALILAKNPNYWGKDKHGNQLPYLDAVRWSYVGDQKSELLNFKKGDLSFTYRLPLEMVDDILDKNGKLTEAYSQFVYQETPALAVQYYGFKMSEGVFAENKKLRQAMNYAIDREKIINYALKGAGVPALGIVPAAFKTYDSKSLKGYDFNPEKAKKLLAEAGFANGKDVGEITLQINSGGSRNEQIAEAIQSMLKENLNLEINITKMPFAQHLEAQETSKTSFWRAGWVADYPDPENFLNLVQSKHIPEKLSDRSYLNTFRYRNAQVDALYEEAQRTLDETKRNDLYRQADQLVINDAPIIPIFYDKDRRLVQPYVKNFPQNAMEYRSFREVYFEPENK